MLYVFDFVKIFLTFPLPFLKSFLEYTFMNKASEAHTSFHIDYKMRQRVGRDKKYAYTDATNIPLGNWNQGVNGRKILEWIKETADKIRLAPDDLSKYLLLTKVSS